MTQFALRLAAALLIAAGAQPALADQKIAFVGALSGPAASAGRDQRDGFLLALQQQNGRLGGVPVQVLQLDDGGGHRRARKIAERLRAEGVRFVTGLTTSDSASALHRQLQGQPILIISSGAGPVELAGAGCAGNFFSTAPVDDAVHENGGAIAQARRYRKIYLVSAPGERAPVESALRRNYSGAILGADAEIRHIRESQPDAVYLALPAAGMRAFLQAYAGAGLFHRIPVIAAGVEPQLLQELGPDFSGLIVSARWSAGMETERSRLFVEAFRASYGRLPTSRAMQGYDAALLLSAGFRAAGEKAPSAAAVADALAQHAVEGVSGPLRFTANRFPVTDWYAWEVFNESSGAPYLAARERTIQDHTGPHGERCKR